MSTSCCPTEIKPAVNDYQGTGSRVTLDGHFDMYIVKGSSPNCLILVYDIFGLTSNAEQLADTLSTVGGYTVVIPDFYKGDPWPHTNIPPTKEGKFPQGVEPADGVNVLMTWITTAPINQFDRKESIQAVKEYLIQEQGMTGKFGAVGMCWGGKVCFVAAKGGLVEAVAACHGSFLDKTDAEETNVPMCLLNSKDEPERYTTEIKPIMMEGKPLFAEKNVFKTFPKMHHGWMGTRGVGVVTDFQQEGLKQGFAEGVSDLVNFFKAALA
jgi:dienelactone hydrolase